MTQRTTTAEKPAQKRQRGRMGCLVIIGVVLLVVVGTVFAPDFPRQAASPSASPALAATVSASATLSVTSTPEVIVMPSESVMLTVEPSTNEKTPLVTKTMPVATLTQASLSPSGTLERETATPIATSSPVRTAAATSTPTRTSPPTPTPTVALILATNTHPPLVLVTNTPSTSGE